MKHRNALDNIISYMISILFNISNMSVGQQKLKMLLQYFH